ncbi:hypothetical protein EUGRSUZ_L02503 [Eucalyptus grandis]|uniref:Uncharacterized protein n=1 Tax=Eucalyptus grandis TaxID=71139 RepID=A0A058ZSR3_EUCGR|nr:hypothetical protein EUGRSUZ_L02503 [Eucalyptus grandis]
MPNARESSLSRWAWKLLRLELLSVRRGGAFKLQLRLLVLKFLKTIGHVATPRSHIWYGERELSFEKMPVVHVKMHRPGSMRFMFPCINPFDDEEGDRAHNGNDKERGIDSRADEFIAKFYEQIKLQRRMSYLQYNEMLNQSPS